VRAEGRIIAVTGAGGFLGRYICRALLARRYRVRALTSQRLAPRDGMEVITLADLLDTNALDRALDGAEILIHLAGVAHVQEGARSVPERYHRANVASVRALCAVAVKVGMSHI
jgi:nucleoside-diphosphate-sugar epimerase